jgi:hypothetical protein
MLRLLRPPPVRRQPDPRSPRDATRPPGFLRISQLLCAARDIIVCLTSLVSVYFYWRSAEEKANPGTTVGIRRERGVGVMPMLPGNLTPCAQVLEAWMWRVTAVIVAVPAILGIVPKLRVLSVPAPPPHPPGRVSDPPVFLGPSADPTRMAKV